MTEVTELLVDWGRGNGAALQRLTPLVYEQLRGMASSYMRRERSDHTLQTTALVNEAYERLVDSNSVNWQDRNHFFAIAATAMRRILVDHARRNQADKRPSGRKLSLDDITLAGDARDPELLALDDALRTLEAVDSRQSRIVELRFFGGMSVAETADAVGVSTATVKREWRIARAWLYRQMDETAHQPAAPRG